MVQITRQRRRRRTINPFRLLVVIFFLVFIACCVVVLLLSRNQQEYYGSASKAAFNLRQPWAFHRTGTDADADVGTSTSKARKRKECGPIGCVIYTKELTNEDTRKDILDIEEKHKVEMKDDNNRKDLLKDKMTPKSPYGSINAGGLSQQGKDHGVNQDRGIIISPFYYTTSQNLQHLPQHHDSENDFLIGIFDGHGDLGHDVAQFLQENFAQRLSSKLSDASSKNNDKLPPEVVKQILNTTFLEMDNELPPIEGTSPSATSTYNIGENGGSTISIILRLGSQLFFANAGDSLSFLGKHDLASKETTILHRNRFDKPHLPDEIERIQKLGGKVFIPKHPMGSRVSAFYPIRKEVMSLGMSRSIGDNSHTRVGVIAEPIVDVINLDELLYSEESGGKNENIGLFVVSSSDGLYDHRQPQFVANHFAKCFFEDEEYPIVCSRSMIDLATPKNRDTYRDDITVLTLKII